MPDLTKPAHPAYGLAEETRQRALADAALMGVAKAAQLHRLSETAIYNWRKRSSLASTLTTPAKEKSMATYQTYGHVADDITRLVCEGQSATPEQIEHCLDLMRECIDADIENEDVPDEVWDVRAEAFVAATIRWGCTHDTAATVALIQRYWDV